MARRTALGGGQFGDQWLCAQAWHTARNIAQGLGSNRQLSEQRPVVILSENDIEHAMLSMGCMIAGVPFIVCRYRHHTVLLVSQDYAKLRHVLDTVTPGLVFAAG